jgi:hypothetical protein
MTRYWPHARALLVTLAIVVGLIEGLPLPDDKQEATMSPGLVGAIHSLEDVRSYLMTPFWWIGEYANVHQRWKLFAGANKLRYRMSIDARAGSADDWHTLYRPLDDEHDFAEDQMAYRRMRGSWAPRGLQGPRGAYPHFVSWIARRIFASDPRWTDVRVQMEKVRIGDTGGDTFTGEFVYPMVRSRGEVMR